MNIFRNLAALAVVGFASGASAAQVDLNTWTAENYPPVSGFNGANWNVAPDGSSVTQTLNGQPAIFYSDFNAQGLDASGDLAVQTNNDDDFIGFVLGFDPGDTSNLGADYLLIDWKQSNQSFNFSGGTADLTPGGLGSIGLSVSRVTGIPTADELWQHEDLAGNGNGGVEELARAKNLGSTGWANNVSYNFSFDFGPNNLVIKVNGVEEFNIAGTFENGRMGFYNFSQDTVNYAAFTTDPGSFAVPLPASAWLLIAAFGGLGVAKRRKS